MPILPEKIFKGKLNAKNTNNCTTLIPMEPANENTPRRLSFFDILFAPIGCLIQMPLLAVAVLAVFALIGTYLYNTQNTDFWGLASHNLDQFTISEDASQFEGKNQNIWKVTYESKRPSEYTGVIRHISPFRMARFPMLTHDILVTSGDFANPDLVKTSVSNHHFFWRSETSTRPGGKINLIHAMPENQDVYTQLLQLRNGDQVTLVGKEILKIDSIAPDGNNEGWWQDAGCNTLLIQSVQINP